jgi:hypothetical protein
MTAVNVCPEVTLMQDDFAYAPPPPLAQADPIACMVTLVDPPGTITELVPCVVKTTV